MRLSILLVPLLLVVLPACAVLGAAAIGFGAGWIIAGPAGGLAGAGAGIAVQFWNDILAFLTKVGHGFQSMFSSTPQGKGGGGGGGAGDGFRWWDPSYWATWAWFALLGVCIWTFIRAPSLAGFRRWIWTHLVALLPGKLGARNATMPAPRKRSKSTRRKR